MRNNNYNEMNEQVEVSEQNLLSLADSMAAAASMFNAHGYDIFVNARDEFKNALRSLYETIGCPV